MKLDTKCQVCQSPMQVDYEPNDFITADSCKAMATCERCLIRRYGRGPAKPKPVKTDTTFHRNPYKD